MFAITINEKGGESKRLEFDKSEITIGRVQGNDIILPKGNVSKRHSRIVFKDGKFIIVDLKSTNGTYVNGRKITSPLVIKGTDKVYIGDFILSVEDAASAAESAPQDSVPPLPPPARRPNTMPPPPPRKPTLPSDDGGGDEDGAAEVAAAPVKPAANPFDDEAAAANGDDQPAEPMSPPARPEPLAPAQAMGAPSRPDARPGAQQFARSAPPRPTPASPPPRPAERPTMLGDAGPAARAAGEAMERAPGAPPASPPMDAPAREPRDAPARQAPGEASLLPPQRPATTMAQPRPLAAARPIAAPSTAAPGAPPPRKSTLPAAPPAPRPVAPAAVAPAPRAPALAAPTNEHHDALIAAMKSLVARLGARLDPNATDVAEAERVAHELAQAMGDDQIPPGLDRETLARDAAAELVGWGPLGALLGEPDVNEVIVTRFDRILVDRGGQVAAVDRSFSSPDALLHVIDRMVAGRVPLSTGLVEVRLDDGTTLTAALPPLSARGATVSLRKPRQGVVLLADLVAQGALSQGMADVLEMAVEGRRTILVSGAAGSARSTLVAALANAITDAGRIVSVEDHEDLQLRHEHWAQLTTRGGAREAIVGALRLRPDRLIIDGLSGSEALLALEAAAGHSGVIASVAGASAGDAVARLEGLSLLAHGAPEVRSLRQSMAHSLHVVVQVDRRTDGGPRVAEVAEITGAGDDGRPTVTSVFLFKSDGGDGRFTATGHVPSFAAGASPSLFRG